MCCTSTLRKKLTLLWSNVFYHISYFNFWFFVQYNLLLETTFNFLRSKVFDFKDQILYSWLGLSNTIKFGSYSMPYTVCHNWRSSMSHSLCVPTSIYLSYSNPYTLFDRSRTLEYRGGLLGEPVAVAVAAVAATVAPSPLIYETIVWLYGPYNMAHIICAFNE